MFTRFAYGGTQLRGFGFAAISERLVAELTAGIEYTLNPREPQAEHWGPTALSLAMGLTALTSDGSVALTFDLIVMPRERCTEKPGHPELCR